MLFRSDLFSEQRLDRSQIKTGQLIDDGLGASVDIRRARVLAVHTIHNAIVVPSVFRHLTFGFALLSQTCPAARWSSAATYTLSSARLHSLPHSLSHSVSREQKAPALAAGTHRSSRVRPWLDPARCPWRWRCSSPLPRPWPSTPQPLPAAAAAGG